VSVLRGDQQRSAWRPGFWVGFLTCAGALVLAVPALNFWVPPNSPAALPDYLVPLLGKYLCYALLALSLDLVWGYAGILSLGHGAFFALGGYCMGMYLMRQIGTRGVYGNPLLPDFMVFLNWKELPWFWWGFDHFVYAAVMVVLVPGVLALVFGWLAFRSRVTGVYLSIITQAMTYALMLAFFRNDMGFGGNNGMTDYKDILGWDVHRPSTRLGLYTASVFALGFGFLLCRYITASKLGRVLQALRDAESRVRFLGYSVTNAKLFVFTLSAVLAGIVGALYVPQVGIINPSEFSPGNSIEIAIWVFGRGARNPGGGDRRGHPRQRSENLADGCRARNLAVCARRAVHSHHPGLPARDRGAIAAPTPDSRSGVGSGAGRRTSMKTAKPLTDSLLYLNGVTVSFDGFKALNELSLIVEEGELRTIIGPNGAGKTTMMDVVTGKTRPDSGEVFFRGTADLSRLEEAEIANLGIGRKFQRPTVFESLTVFENLELALADSRGTWRTLVAQLTPDRRDHIAAILARIGLAENGGQPAGSLSHGQKQWLEIGMLLIHDRSLLLLDEPVAGMTDRETEETADLILELARDRTIVVVEHDMAFVRSLGARVTVLHEGAVLAEGSIDHVQNHPRVIEVYLGR